MYCEICGAINDDNAKKCKKCGYVFGDSKEKEKTVLDNEVKNFKQQNNKKIKGWRVKRNVIVTMSVLFVISIGILLGFYYYNSIQKLTLEEVKKDLTGETKLCFYKNKVLITDSPVEFEGKKYRVGKDGYVIENKIITINNNDYCYGDKGVLNENKWFRFNNNDMYAGDNGIIVKNKWIDEKYLDGNGIMLKNTIVNNMYYVGIDGVIVKSQWVDEHYYGDDGKLYINKRTPDGIKVDENGDKILPPEQQIFNSNFRFSTLVKFGSFEQDGNEENGAEPIEWYLLRGQYDKALLIAKNVLLCLPYQVEEQVVEYNSWKDSYLKNHLKGWFYNLVFDDIEKQSIYVDENLGEIFVPSIDEMKKYLPNDLYKICTPTPVAKDSTKFSQINNLFSTYWLRDDGANGKRKAFVTDMGQIITNDLMDELELNEQFLSYSNADIISDDAAEKIKIYISSQIPLLNIIIKQNDNSNQLVKNIYVSIVNRLKEDGYENKNTEIGLLDYKKVIDLYLEKYETPVEALNIIKKRKKNIYKDIGKVTNEFNGVRPMIYIDMQKSK